MNYELQCLDRLLSIKTSWTNIALWIWQLFDVSRDVPAVFPRRGYAKYAGKFNSEFGDFRVKMIADDENENSPRETFPSDVTRLPHFFPRASNVTGSVLPELHRNETRLDRDYPIGVNWLYGNELFDRYTGGKKISPRGNNAVQTIIKP